MTEKINSSHKEVPYYGDLGKTQILQDLFETPTEKRGEEWKKTFLENVKDASFSCGNPQILTGPDGFPYFQLRTTEPYKEFECYVLKHMKDDFLLSEGYGVAINAHKDEPDWVFSYGDIVNYHIRQEFYTDSSTGSLQEKDIINDQEEILTGQPDESILPMETRNVIREYLSRHGIIDCKILLMNRGTPEGITREIVFNITSDQFENEAKYEDIMGRISWFLPRHYIYDSMNESGFENNFVPI